jgi:uncharacterized protein (DUF1015 family)
MSLIQPFAGFCPAPGQAEQIIAPPYDVVSTDEARAIVAARPMSFITISRPEVHFPSATAASDPQVYEQAGKLFRHWCNAGYLIQDAKPYYYLYRLTMNGRSQNGLVALASVSAYQQGRIKKHELTRPDKEHDRVQHIQAVQAQTGPVFLVYRDHDQLQTVLTDPTQEQRQADIDCLATDGIRHQLWRITETTHIETITQAFADVDALYIADGHHRAAAAARVANDHSSHAGFLAVLFPCSQTQIFAYNRLIQDLNGFSAEQFLQQIQKQTNWTITPCSQPIEPQHKGAFGLCLDGQWYHLVNPNAQPMPAHSDDPLAYLDVAQLHQRIIDPILGIHDVRHDSRIQFVGGIRGTQGLITPIAAGLARVGFTLYPTAIEELLAVADAGLMMPPKSTWFEPKLADGLICHALF